MTTDKTRSGGRTYTANEGKRVQALFRGLKGPGAARTVTELAGMTGLEGRTLRQIVGDGDGVTYLEGENGHEGMFACEWADEGDGKTAELKALVRTLEKRIERREKYARGMPRRQGRLL